MCKILKKSGAISRIKTEGVKKIHYKNFIKIPETTTIGGSVLYTNAPIRLERFTGDSNNKLAQESLVYSQEGGRSP